MGERAVAAYITHRLQVGDAGAVGQQRLAVDDDVFGQALGQLAGHAGGVAFVDRIRELELVALGRDQRDVRSEEHTSELQSLMRISYAVFCLKKKNTNTTLAEEQKVYMTQLEN